MSAKAPILELGRYIDNEAARITNELLKIEGPIDEQIKNEERRKEEERLAKIEAERQRVEGIQNRIASIRAALSSVVNTPSSVIGDYIRKVERIARERQAELDRQEAERQAAIRAEEERLAAERAQFERQQAEARAAAETERKRREEQARLAAIKKPADIELLDVLAKHYNVPHSKVVEWLLAVDFSSLETEAGMNVEFPTHKPLLARLDESACELCREAAARIRAMQKEHREELRQLDKDARDDARAAAAEARWQAHEDYRNSDGGW